MLTYQSLFCGPASTNVDVKAIDLNRYRRLGGTEVDALIRVVVEKSMRRSVDNGTVRSGYRSIGCDDRSARA